MKKKCLALLLIYCISILEPRAQFRDTTQPAIPLQFDPDLLFRKAGKPQAIGWILLPVGIIVATAGVFANFTYPLPGPGAINSKKYLWIPFLRIGSPQKRSFFLKAWEKQKGRQFYT